VEIVLCLRHADLLAGPGSVSVRDRTHRLMDVADEVDEKGEVTGGTGTPFVVIRVTRTLGVVIDFRRDAIPLEAPPR
jgi:hypothetical protein